MLTIGLRGAVASASRSSGPGRLARTPEMDADLTLRFNDTSLDPVPPLLRAEDSHPTTRRRRRHASARSANSPTSITSSVEATVDKLQLKLFDYPAANDGPIQLALEPARRRSAAVPAGGDKTALELSGNDQPARQPDRARRVRRREPGHPAGVLSAPSEAPGSDVAARADQRVRSTSRCSPATRRLPAAASALRLAAAQPAGLQRPAACSTRRASASSTRRRSSAAAR